jgi:indole-3-glycerol phosphate synthase
VILHQIAAAANKRVAQLKTHLPLETLKAQAEARTAGKKDFPFEKALALPSLSFICEIKKASPSKGIIAADFPYLTLARDYEEGGAAAISVLTEPEFFLGRDEYLTQIAASARIPLLRKDFVVDAYQIYQARILGADAVLLICALSDEKALSEYIEIADSLGLSALVEAHTASEVACALHAGARIIGVNNRDLHDFSVDINHSLRLRKLIPSNIFFVAESGINSPDHIRALRENGADAVLIGEAIMKAADKKQYLRELKAI